MKPSVHAILGPRPVSDPVLDALVAEHLSPGHLAAEAEVSAWWADMIADGWTNEDIEMMMVLEALEADLNRAWRCDERDQHNHRCTHKAGHDDPDIVAHPTQHLAFGRTWKVPAPAEDEEGDRLPADDEGVS